MLFYTGNIINFRSFDKSIKLNDSDLKKKKAEMDVEFEKNNIKKGDANFQYDIRKEFDHEQYAAEWDDESY